MKNIPGNFCYYISTTIRLILKLSHLELFQRIRQWFNAELFTASPASELRIIRQIIQRVEMTRLFREFVVKSAWHVSQKLEDKKPRTL